MEAVVELGEMEEVRVRKWEESEGIGEGREEMEVAVG